MREQMDEKQKIVETLREIPFISGACLKAGIPRSTVYRWLNEDAIFANKIKKAINRGNQMVNDMAYGKLIQKIKEGNMPAIVYHLSRRHPYYKDKNKNDLKIKVEQKKNNLSEDDLGVAIAKACNNIKLSKLPKKLRKKIVRRGMDIHKALNEVAEQTYKESGINLFEKGSEIPWWMIIRDILEEEPYQKK